MARKWAGKAGGWGKSQCTDIGVDVEIVILDVGLTFEVYIEITFEELSYMMVT